MKKKIVLALITVTTTLSLTSCERINQAVLEEEPSSLVVEEKSVEEHALGGHAVGKHRFAEHGNKAEPHGAHYAGYHALGIIAHARNLTLHIAAHLRCC